MSQAPPLNITQKFRSWADKEDENLRRATRSVGGFALTGFLLGMLAIVVQEKLHQHVPAQEWQEWQHYLELLLEHGGLGLVVSSIAVFGYEWRSHARKAFQLSEDLKRAIAEVTNIEDLVRLSKELAECNAEFKRYTAEELKKFEAQSIENRMARDKSQADFAREREENVEALKVEMAKMQSAEALQVFDQSITALLGNDEKKSRLRKHIQLIVESAYKLKQKQDENTVQYLNVISWLIGETVVENARTLVNLSDGTGAEWHYKVPTSSAKMAARILGAHMKVMAAGESYDTISDVRLWKNEQLKYFAEKTKEALDRGVKVRRVFNLCTLDLPENDGEETTNALERVNAIINEHLDAMKESGGNYSVRFFSTINAPKVQTLTGRKITDIQGANFGLFRNVKPDRIIRFVVEDIKLSSMRISYCQSGDPDVRLFEAMWGEASTVNPLAEDVV